MNCIHNARSRYTHGYHCRDCDTFFPCESSTYRKTEYMTSLWMALHNLEVRYQNSKLPLPDDVRNIKEKIGIGEVHEDYETLIAEAEAVLRSHSASVESIYVELKG